MLLILIHGRLQELRSIRWIRMVVGSSRTMGGCSVPIPEESLKTSYRFRSPWPYALSHPCLLAFFTRKSFSMVSCPTLRPRMGARNPGKKP